MRRLPILLVLAACGEEPQGTPDAPSQEPDAAMNCQPQGATGTFYRRQGNPRIVAGTHRFTDSTADTEFADPDVLSYGSTWMVFYQSAHGASFAAPPNASVIRRVTSANLTVWSFDEQPTFAAANSGAWDALTREAPS